MARYRLSQHDNKHALSTCTIDVNQCACSMRPNNRVNRSASGVRIIAASAVRAPGLRLTLGVGPGTCTRSEVI